MQPLHFPAGMFFLTFSFKTIANSNRQIQRLYADAANEFIRLISLINSYLLFSFIYFFHDNVFAIRCISYTEYSSGLNLGEGLCIFTSFHFPDSDYLLTGFDF